MLQTEEERQSLPGWKSRPVLMLHKAGQSSEHQDNTHIPITNLLHDFATVLGSFQASYGLM